MAEKHVHKVYGSFPPWGKSVEFPASGGGGNYVYYSGTLQDFSEGVAMASIIKANMNGDIVFMPSGVFWTTDANNENIIGAGFDTSMKMTSWGDSSELITVGDVLAEPSKEWTQITEEEFYKIPTQFTFTLNGEPKKYVYEEGMTWGEWIDSPYNDGNFSVKDANMGEGIQAYAHYEYSAIGYNNTDDERLYVKPTDLIQPDINYYVNNQVG